MAKLRNASRKVEIRARQADLKEARAKLVGDKSKKAEDEARRIQTLAAQTCQRISNWHKEKPERFASLKANIKKGLLKPSAKAVKTVSKVICPTYFTFDKQYMVSVAKRNACEEKNILQVWCTTSFRHFVFGGKSQLLMIEPDPTHNFQLFVERMLLACLFRDLSVRVSRRQFAAQQQDVFGSRIPRGSLEIFTESRRAVF